MIRNKIINKSNISRVGHLILRALAIQASNPQNALTCISFHSPKKSPPPPHHDHAVAMACQLGQQNRNVKFVFRNLLAKRNVKHIVYLAV